MLLYKNAEKPVRDKKAEKPMRAIKAEKPMRAIKAATLSSALADNASGAEKHASNLEEAGYKSLFTNIISLL
jgi:hypothetical protein